MNELKSILLAGVGSVAFAAAAMGPAGIAQAQTAGQLVSPTYAPPAVRPVDGGLSLEGSTAQEAPKGAEKLRVTPSGLSVQGARPELAAETARVEASLKGKQVTGADLFAAARQLEEIYAKAGFILVRVSLPPQTIKNGMPLRLVVTDGQVEAIDASALSPVVRSRIETMLSPLVGKSGLTKADVERKLLLAGDMPGVMLKSTLKAGSKPGSTIIVIDGRYDAMTSTVTFDDSLGRNLGTFAMGLGVDFNSMLGLGEVGYLRMTGYPGFNNSIASDDPRNRQIVAGFTLPLGMDGAWLNMEGVDSRTNPTSDFAYTMEDHYQRLSTKLGYSWVRSRDFNTSSVIAYDVLRERQKLDLAGTSTPFTEDQLRVFRLSQTADVILPWGASLGGNLSASFGVDSFGARSATSALPLSRDGAEPDFSKLELAVNYGQSMLNERAHLTIAGKAQTSFGDALSSSEQFGIAGFDWLSAFDGGKLQGDGGVATRAEVSFPIVLGMTAPFGGAVAPYIFGAAGLTKLERPSAVEDAITRATSFGAGLRVGLSEQATPHSTTLTLEYAHGTATGLEAENRFNLRFNATF
ncbi:ShlB/FhaC/HecB family hemolysin secretion/activation protein [Rhizobium skierniewicense]|uniref:ShlB/FhaC/HecB family hemolysin secretion/activation protein n=1 Tax=Rhizobium skierniewicense TaxID=984260 RepID=UPI001FABF0CC|nr:ShlB/FhaC/HecB family hemolysin secretion/activation protein [Rhizobium skierniewicense]MCI9867678.1 ShlB/FhaC/HecB family hemolysin secretion/activation protein [Rhizobium skierniewicense]